MGEPTSDYDRQEDDWYVEPMWCTSALLAYERFEGPIWDPCCGLGNVLSACSQAGFEVYGSDIVNRAGLADFIAEADFTKTEVPLGRSIIGNVPFGLFNEFAEQACRLMMHKAALFIPLTYLPGNKRCGRYRLFQDLPLSAVYIMADRPSCPPGEQYEAFLRGEADEPAGGKRDYCWVVFEAGFEGAPVVRWLVREDADRPPVS